MKNALMFLFLTGLFGLQAASVDIKTAVDKKLISVSAKGNGGFQGPCMKLKISNNTALPVSIEVPPGTIFTDQDKGAQNLMIVEEYIVDLKPKQNKEWDVQTMCIEHHDYAPAGGDLFVLSSIADGFLRDMAKIIAKNNYQNSTSQSAVWAITDNTLLSDIYSVDTTMASQLINLVCSATNQPRPAIIMPREHHLFSIRFDFAHHFQTPTKLTLKCYDGAGNVLKTYYENRVVPTGVYISTFGINKVSDKESKFIFKLTDDKGNVVEQRTVTESINEQSAVRYEKKVNFEYILKTAVSQASLKLYDDKGNLLEVVWANRNLPAGGRRQAYSFFHLKGENAAFVLKVHDGNGKVVAEQTITGPSKKINN